MRLDVATEIKDLFAVAVDVVVMRANAIGSPLTCANRMSLCGSRPSGCAKSFATSSTLVTNSIWCSAKSVVNCREMWVIALATEQAKG